MALSKCGQDGCDPQEQIRGQHHAHDRADINTPEAGKTLVHMDDEIQHDMRIMCTKCGKTTGWDRVDIEEYKSFGPGDNRRVVKERDGNKENIRQRWNALIG